MSRIVLGKIKDSKDFMNQRFLSISCFSVYPDEVNATSTLSDSPIVWNDKANRFPENACDDVVTGIIICFMKKNVAAARIIDRNKKKHNVVLLTASTPSLRTPLVFSTDSFSIVLIARLQTLDILLSKSRSEGTFLAAWISCN